MATLAVATTMLLVAASSAGARDRPPSIDAAAAIVVDADSGAVLYEREADDRRAIASTTKLMTALLTLEQAEPDELIEAADYAALPVESTLGLEPGEQMSVEDLLAALLLESANDAAVTLAEGISGSREEFVEQMNARARELRLADTSYANPIGLDDARNYSTARDLASLAARLMENEQFAEIVGWQSAELETGARRRVIENRNRLVADGFVDGVKTGFTREAGNVLVGSAEEKGIRVISVVMGEPTEAGRDADTVALLRYGLSRFRKVEVIERGETLASAPIRFHEGDRVDLIAARSFSLTAPRGAQGEPEVLVDPIQPLEGPLPTDVRVGAARVFVDGDRRGNVALQTAEPVPGPTLSTRAGLYLQRRIVLIVVAITVVVGILVLVRSRTRRSRRPEDRRK
ncbi:MAG: D-alanyl-D-alanine carboxypeptidase [Thermoleophilaceae bacterium]|nr:D-alanyl-D-alanine carboxypeptidase [Thermoleophilaceae bacterium]